MRIIKFGGSSLANAERLQAAAQIVAWHRARESVAVVVSAMAGITDALIAVTQRAVAEQEIDQATLERINQQHEAIYREYLGHAPAAFTQQWDALSHDAAALLLAGPDDEARVQNAAFSGWGERLMAPLFALALTHNGVTAAAYPHAPVVLESWAEAHPSPVASLLATRAWLVPQLAMVLAQQITPILPGYVARDVAGRPTTLGRNGSDYSAALIAAALGANSLYIYSDVAGVYSADPKHDPQAVLLPALTYAEAAGFAAHGAKVLHPRTIGPLERAAIPLWLRSAWEPEREGTVIGNGE